MTRPKTLIIAFVMVFALGLTAATITAAGAMLSSVDHATLQSHPLLAPNPQVPIPAAIAMASSVVKPYDSISVAPPNPWASLYPLSRSARTVDGFVSADDGTLPAEFSRFNSGAMNLSNASAPSVRMAEANPPLPGEADVVVCLSTERVWGVVTPGDTVTVTVDDVQMGADLADHIGFFWTTLYDLNGIRPGLGAGDQVAIYQDGVQKSSLALRSISGEINAVEDIVSGTIGGAGFPISVTVYVPLAEPSMTSYSQTVSTDSSGNFETDFTGIFDLATWDEAIVAYVDNDVEVHRHVYPTPGLMVRHYPYNWVFGIAPPGTSVTVTVYLSDAVSVKASDVVDASPPSGFYFATLGVDILESDIVSVEMDGGEVRSLTVERLTMQMDSANDRITGEAQPYANVRGVLYGLTSLGMGYYSPSTTANASGLYTLELSSIMDLLPGQTAAVMVADAEGDELNARGYAPSVEVNQTWNEVSGTGAFSPGDATSGQPVTATIYSSVSDTVSTYNAEMDWYGYYYLSEENDGLPDIEPGDIVTVESALVAQPGVVEVKTITVVPDLDNDRFTGTIEPPSNRIELYGSHAWEYLFPLGGYFETYTTANSPYTASISGFDVDQYIWYDVFHRTSDGNIDRISRSLNYGVFINANVVLGSFYPPGSAYTITLYDSEYAYKASISGESKPPIGDIGWHDFWESGEQILPGDYIQAQSTSGFSMTVQVPDLEIHADVDQDLIYGSAPANSLLTIIVDEDGEGFVPTDSQGNFKVSLSEMQNLWGNNDLSYGENLGLEYVDENNIWFFKQINWEFMRVNYAHDWVGGNYAADHTFWITPTDSAGKVKGYAEIESTPGAGWGGSGFETRWEDWLLQQPDIQAGDWVNIASDDGYSNAIRVGTITGEPDFENNTISGTIQAGWITETVEVRCEVWEENGPDGIQTSVDPDGGAYECDFDDVGWDLQPGHHVAVMYIEPDGDLVINVFPSTQPNLQVEKWADGNPAQDGNMVFKIQYYNHGNGIAEDTILTDTLWGMEYISQTSGIPAVVNSHAEGDTLVIDLGDLPKEHRGYFEIFAHVTASENDWVTNTVEIATSNPYEEGDESELIRTWNAQVTGNDTYLNINKWPVTGNPAPGYNYMYEVQTCNNGSTDSAPVIVTDTLPLSTTLVTWWGQYGGWSEVSRGDNQLVVSRPSIGAGQCSSIYLQANLSSEAWDGMEITNTARIYSASDLDFDNNEAIMQHNAGSPRADNSYNLSIYKDWISGQLVPGGTVNYELSYRNEGNVPASDVRITSTLPLSTTFLRAVYEDEYGRTIITPALTTDDYVVWNIGDLDPGEWGRFNIQLAIDWDAQPGMMLMHIADITRLPEEFHTQDNQVFWIELLNDYGPNLRVEKQNYRWYDEDEVEHEVHIFNLGSEWLDEVYITDTYPVSTSLAGWYQGHGPQMDVSHNASERQLVIWLDELQSGDTANLIFQLDLDGEIVGQQGLVFTNTVEAPWPGDVNLADNTYTLVYLTGPDVFIEKWISDGEIEPGELVTFTVHFGNSARWPWDTDTNLGSLLTDTLPAEMTYVNATAPWNRDETWDPYITEDNQLVWGWGPMWSQSNWYFNLVVQITDTVQGGDVFTNTIVAYGDNPDELETVWSNNVSEVPMLVINPMFEIGKSYQSNHVAGSLVTYTLNVTNTGNEAATNVQVKDTLPAEVVYGGGGSFGGGDLTWNIPSLASLGGNTSLQYWGTLSCNVDNPVDNENYFVESCDQGASSAKGPLVSFNLVSPSILADFIQSTATIRAGETVYFTSTSATDGSMLSYGWDFGDGYDAIGATTMHQFDALGNFTVTLTVTDTCGLGDSATANVQVNTYVYLPAVFYNFANP